MRRLSIDISEEQHQSLKVLAAMQGKTLKQYALERLFPLEDAQTEQAWGELKALLQQRIQAGLAGKVSRKSIEQVLDEELSQGN